MYKVRLHPKKCPLGRRSWVSAHKEGEIIEIADNHFKPHEEDRCMTPLEHYRIVRVKRKCPTCYQEWIKHKKVVL